MDYGQIARRDSRRCVVGIREGADGVRQRRQTNTHTHILIGRTYLSLRCDRGTVGAGQILSTPSFATLLPRVLACVFPHRISIISVFCMCLTKSDSKHFSAFFCPSATNKPYGDGYSPRSTHMLSHAFSRWVSTDRLSRWWRRLSAPSSMDSVVCGGPMWELTPAFAVLSLLI